MLLKDFLRYLDTHEKKNKALTAGDIKKSRRRNIVPAKLGYVHISGLFLVWIIYFMMYSLDLNLDSGLYI